MENAKSYEPLGSTVTDELLMVLVWVAQEQTEFPGTEESLQHRLTRAIYEYVLERTSERRVFRGVSADILPMQREFAVTGTEIAFALRNLQAMSVITPHSHESPTRINQEQLEKVARLTKGIFSSEQLEELETVAKIALDREEVV